VLETYTGADGAELARARAESLCSALGRGDIRVRRAEGGAAVVMGSYARYDAPGAQRDLEFARRVTVGGRRPYARAFLSPPPTVTDPGETPQLSLTRAREQYGRRAVYTLQIGVYESRDPEVAKRAAEEAALSLRNAGDLGFYYHGPTRSMVTVGVFGPDDYDETLGIRSPALAALRDKYPLNLLNGQFPIIVRREGGRESEQRSLLVRIPE